VKERVYGAALRAFRQPWKAGTMLRVKKGKKKICGKKPNFTRLCADAPQLAVGSFTEMDF